jgi:hypothetical protein
MGCSVITRHICCFTRLEFIFQSQSVIGSSLNIDYMISVRFLNERAALLLVAWQYYCFVWKVVILSFHFQFFKKNDSHFTCHLASFATYADADMGHVIFFNILPA